MTLAWHFVGEDKRLRTGEVVEAGKTYRAEGVLALCRNGMHASVRAIDALGYAPGPFVCRVGLLGEIVRDSDKVCARSRHVLWVADATLALHEFGCWCAEQALALVEPDPRSVAAIETKRRWLRGEASLEDLDAARAAARDAAWAADWAAEPPDGSTTAGPPGAADWAVDWDAAGAAWAAARGDARDAAWAAAWDAAWAAAWDARDTAGAAGAAWSAVRDAARERQNARLEQMLQGLEQKARNELAPR